MNQSYKTALLTFALSVLFLSIPSLTVAQMGEEPGPCFAVWDSDEYKSLVSNQKVGNTIKAVNDLVGFKYPLNTNYQSLHFEFTFEDNIGNVLNIPNQTNNTYKVIIQLPCSSVPTPNNIECGSTNFHQYVRFNLATTVSLLSNSPIRVHYAIFGEDLFGNINLILGGGPYSYYQKGKTNPCLDGKILPASPTKRVAEELSSTNWAYPNPVQDQLMISSLPTKSTLELIDAMGQVVLSIELAASKDPIRVKLNDLPAGIYLAVLVDRPSFAPLQLLKLQ